MPHLRNVVNNMSDRKPKSLILLKFLSNENRS